MRNRMARAELKLHSVCGNCCYFHKSQQIREKCRKVAESYIAAALWGKVRVGAMLNMADERRCNLMQYVM